MIKLFIKSSSLVCTTLLISCSFSKESTSNDIHSPEKKSQNISNTQEEILIAVKSGDIEKLRLSIGSAKISDFNFKISKVTPFSVALENQDLGMLKELKNLGFDHFDLGSLSESVNNKFFEMSLKNSLKKLKHSDADKIDISLSDSEQFIYAEQQITLGSALASKSQDISTLKSYNILCPFLESQIIILQASSSVETLANAQRIIKSLQCSNAVKMTQLHRIYHMELISQFQKRFSDRSLLKYLVHHKGFENPMWNIDNSNIMVSPALLYRMSFYRQSSEDNINNESSDAFLKSIEMPLPRYELIHITESRRYSFAHFPEMALNDSDVFFEKLYAYMHGQKVYNTSTDPDIGLMEKPWIINFQESDDGFYE